MRGFDDGGRENGSAVHGELVKTGRGRDVSKATESYGCSVAITRRLSRQVWQGEVEVGERFSRLRLYTAAMAFTSTAKLFYRGAVRCDAVLW